MIEQFRHPNAWVEILVLAVAYYAVLTFIRGTRGAPVLKGLVVVFVVAFLGFMYLADVLGLPHLKLLLQWILSGSAIALLIIFAPELRRAMQHVAQSPLLLPLLRPASTAAVSEIANAAVKLSKNRIGALLAIERDVGLNEYVEKGCRIDAALTSDLLETIFFPGSALHDGAIVVRGDRVAAAGCLFPLTDDMSLSKSIGTRHRAALGISEETDAVAVVVSEETGRISVAVDGRLTVDLTRDQLVKLLGELAARSSQSGAATRPPLDIAVEIDTKAVTRPAPPPADAAPGNGREDAPKKPGSGTHVREFLNKEEGRAVKQYVLGNLGTFAMALLLSLVTWTYLFTQGIGPGEVVVEFQPAPLDPETFATIEYRTASGEILVPGGTFKVRVDGPKGDVRSIELRPPRTFRCELAVDPKDLSEDNGTLKLTLDRAHFTIPEAGNMRIQPLLPGGAQITVHYVKFVERTLELKATRFDVDGSPLRGFRVESVTPSIPRLKCRIPADRAELIRPLGIRTVPVSGKQESFTLEWEIAAADRQRRIKPVETFRVEVRIVPDVFAHRITVDLGMSGRPDVLRRVELETKSILLEIQGPEELVKEAPESVFAPFVVVTERDVQTAGPQNLTEIGCHVLDPKYRGFTVVPMADIAPANRTVKIKVLPK